MGRNETSMEFKKSQNALKALVGTMGILMWVGLLKFILGFSLITVNTLLIVFLLFYTFYLEFEDRIVKN